jgi:hypothetical protein
MCHWLTVAAANRAVLAPLREFGAALEPVEFPALPPAYQHLQRYLVPGNGCSCSLMARANHTALAAALTTARLVGGVLLVHRTFGDEPRGQRRLGPTEPRDAAAATGREAELEQQLLALAHAQNRAGGRGTAIPATFLRVTVRR